MTVTLAKPAPGEDDDSFHLEVAVDVAPDLRRHPLTGNFLDAQLKDEFAIVDKCARNRSCASTVALNAEISSFGFGLW